MRIDEKVIKRAELARLIGKSLSTINNYIKAGRYKKHGAKIAVNQRVICDILSPPTDGRKKNWLRIEKDVTII